MKMICPNCKVPIEFSDSMIGQTVSCPRCGVACVCEKPGVFGQAILEILENQPVLSQKINNEDNIKKAIEAFKAERWAEGLATAAKTDYGDAFLCDWVGYCYADGKGVAKDSAEAVKWFLKAAEMGSAWSMNELGRYYENGWGVAADMTKAMEWYRKWAEKGNADAQKSIKRLSEENEPPVIVLKPAAKKDNSSVIVLKPAKKKLVSGVEEEKEKGAVKVEDSALLELVRSVAKKRLRQRLYFCLECGEAYNEPNLDGRCWCCGGMCLPNEDVDGGAVVRFSAPDAALRNDIMSAVQRQDWSVVARLSPKMSVGDPEVLMALGRCYEEGLGTSSSLYKALECYARASKGGSAESTYRIYRILGRGYTARSALMSRSMLMLSALRGWRPAQLDFARSLIYGWNGFEKDAPSGVAILNMIGREASCDLAICYRDGIGVKQDVLRAFRLFEDDATSDWSPTAIESTFLLGKLYYDTAGSDDDLSNAESWLEKALRQRDVAEVRYMLARVLMERHCGSRALVILNEAVLSDSAYGCKAKRLIGSLYCYGDKGVRQDLCKAYEILSDAVKKGDDEAVPDLLRVGELCAADSNASIFADIPKAIETLVVDHAVETIKGGEEVEASDIKKGVALLSKAADSGSVRAIAALRDFFENGKGTGGEVNEYEQRLKRMAFKSFEQGDARGGIRLGRLAHSDDAVLLMEMGRALLREQDGANWRNEAIDCLDKSAKLGCGEAAWLLYGLFSRGEVVPRDELRAESCLSRAADLGWNEALRTRALFRGENLMFGMRGEERSTSDAVRWLKEAGPRGLLILADCYRKGEGVRQDVLEAERLYMLIANEEDLEVASRAAYELGTFYLNDDDLHDADDEKAGYWYSRFLSASSCSENVKTRFAAAYCDFRNGRYGAAVSVLENDEILSVEEFRPSAEFCLGVIYRDGGDGVAADLAIAKLWLRRSVSAGCRRAMRVLEEMPSDNRSHVCEKNNQIGSCGNDTKDAHAETRVAKQQGSCSVGGLCKDQPSQVKIGKVVQQVFPVLFSEGRVGDSDIAFLMSPAASKQFKTGGYQVLKEIVDDAVLEAKDTSGINRFYTKFCLPFGSKKFMVTSQWFKNGLPNLLTWIERHGITVERVMSICGADAEGTNQTMPLASVLPVKVEGSVDLSLPKVIVDEHSTIASKPSVANEPEISSADDSIKIGKVVQTVFPVLFAEGRICDADIDFLMSTTSIKFFKTCGNQVLRQVIENVEKEAKDENGHNRFYTKFTLPYGGKNYMVTSQWFRNGLSNLLAWIEQHGVSNERVRALYGCNDILAGGQH